MSLKKGSVENNALWGTYKRVYLGKNALGLVKIECNHLVKNPWSNFVIW